MTTKSGLIGILRQELAELLSAESVPHSAACAVTEKLIEHLQDRYGGDSVFIPAIDRSKRDSEIMASWRAGQKPAELAKLHGVNVTTVYRIIGRSRSQRKASDADEFGRPEWAL